jgi:hypothetical protein
LIAISSSTFLRENKRYDHLGAIITRNMLFPTIHKVRDEMVLEEIMLGPDTPVALPQMFYSNNTSTSPPPFSVSSPW